MPNTARQEAKQATADWQALHPLLERCYVGPPAGRSGNFPGAIFTLCKLLRGSVEMKKGNHSIQADANNPAWILTTPGTRWQHFSDDSEIVSIHIALGNPQNGAEWSGPQIISVKPDSAGEKALAELVNCPVIKQLSPGQRLELQALKLSIPDYLELQKHTLEILKQSLLLAERAGMRYQVPSIQDPRVNASYRYLAALDIRESFDRGELAAREGLTAGQLDRLWRSELGQTPNHYRDRQRLTYACRQLRRPEIPIKVIAADLGFRHLSQFSNWFSTRHGESPRSYRKRPGTN
ncbi:helix-turn-helix domain-containing protein [Coraliomargarita parva]|uniref:helix-turn-helix domain-containing protein n=1 Tax=Coraliomargarita parva TaxID=3014050 RepID=UPI0022B4CA79|nr:helix-turn-helix domain-containing protein [Coraliomargarita parva]